MLYIAVNLLGRCDCCIRRVHGRPDATRILPDDSLASASFCRKARRLTNGSVIKVGRCASTDSAATSLPLTTIRLGNSLDQLGVTLDSREAIVNGVRNWLCFPVTEKTWREKLAQSIATGIINYKGLVDRKTRPMMVADYRHEFDGQLVLKDAKTPVKPEAASAPVVIPASN